MSDDGDDNNDEQPPHLRVVSDNPSARSDRRVAWAKDEVERTLAAMAAALLRIMAGNSSEATYFMHRVSNFLDALKKYREESRIGLSVADLEKALRWPRKETEWSDEEWRRRQWIREDGMEAIVKGALRLAAHKVLGEEPAFGGMHSERVIEQGIKTLEELKRPSPPPKANPRKRGELAGSWEDIDLEPPPANRREEPTEPITQKAGRRRAGFRQDDLRELRRAIKANDKKRIAELTAKLGKPSFDN